MTPLDLARWRALAEASLRELPQCSECDGGWEPQPDGMHRWWIGEGETRMVLSQFQCPQHPQAALSTALRAACDEVERLREALDIERERRIITVGTMAEHIADVQAAFVEGMRCTGSSEEVALDMWRHSDALGKLRHTGAFEQAYLGQESPHAK